MFRQHKEKDLFPETWSFCQEQFSLLLLPPSETAQLVGNATVSKDPKSPFQMFTLLTTFKTSSFKSQQAFFGFAP